MKPIRKSAGYSMDVETFTRDLTLFRTLHPRFRSRHSIEGLRELGKNLSEVVEGSRANIKVLSTEMRKDWPQSPLLTNESIFIPLGIQYKEVPLTRALASWLDCGRAESELARQSLAATLALVLDRKAIEKNDLQSWCVTAEENIGGDKSNGRIDIFLRGNINGKENCIAIEAKVNAKEGVGQLAKYAQALKNRYPKAKPTIVLLTRGGEKASSLGKSRTKIRTLTYESLLRVLLPVLRGFEDKGEQSSDFGRLLLADIARLCGVHIGSQGGDREIFQLERILLAQRGSGRGK